LVRGNRTTRLKESGRASRQGRRLKNTDPLRGRPVGGVDALAEAKKTGLLKSPHNPKAAAPACSITNYLARGGAARSQTEKPRPNSKCVGNSKEELMADPRKKKKEILLGGGNYSS